MKNIVDFYVCSCGKLNPLNAVCECEINRKIETEVQLAQFKLISDILCELDNSIPAEPFTERAKNSWREKYADILYIRKIIENKREEILNRGR